ncbi:hypothetical protein AB4298_07460 [Shewanella sp. 10N.261.52.F9]|uniref:hypothetical protein n=1 Tax=Shewanella sp. 10N.261.52.F9 TaxID=3229684 RepID=UPI00354F8DF0
MAFESQLKKSRVAGRRGSSAIIVVSQSYKPSTKSEELSIRVDVKLLSKVGLSIGSKVDVLFDGDSNLWMVKKSNDGFTISGKVDGPTGLIRYTLKEGHSRLTAERANLPVKMDVDEACLVIENDSIIFALQS